jgi:hypothetical protein
MGQQNELERLNSANRVNDGFTPLLERHKRRQRHDAARIFERRTPGSGRHCSKPDAAQFGTVPRALEGTDKSLIQRFVLAMRPDRIAYLIGD